MGAILSEVDHIGAVGDEFFLLILSWYNEGEILGNFLVGAEDNVGRVSQPERLTARANHRHLSDLSLVVFHRCGNT